MDRIAVKTERENEMGGGGERERETLGLQCVKMRFGLFTLTLYYSAVLRVF
jgi:hypothetical protein